MIGGDTYNTGYCKKKREVIMKIGKIPETILKRSVYKQIRHRRPEVLVRPGIGKDCSFVELGPDEVCVLSTDPITGTVDEIGSLAVHVTANDIACSKAEMIGIMVSILLPYPTSEQDLKALMHEMEAECEKLGIEILGGHTECTKAVNQPIVTVTGIGKVKKQDVPEKKAVKAGQEIIMTKWAGLEGTAILAKAKEQELKTRYAASFVEGAKELLSYVSVVPEATICRNLSVTAMHDVTEGGIYGALWELGAAANLGVEVDLDKIPFKQETIELCEFFDLNPYHLISSGSLLVVTSEANRIVTELERQGIKATVIGKMIEGNERVVYNTEERKYLAPAKSDELYKVLG